MESDPNSITSRLGLAIGLSDESAFQTAVSQILSADHNAHPERDTLGIPTGDLSPRSTEVWTEVSKYILELKTLEYRLAGWNSESNMHYSQQCTAFCSMIGWLTEQLDAQWRGIQKHHILETLQQQIARWRFWLGLLSSRARKVAFCSGLQNLDSKLTVSEFDLDITLMRARQVLRSAVEVLGGRYHDAMDVSGSNLQAVSLRNQGRVRVNGFTRQQPTGPTIFPLQPTRQIVYRGSIPPIYGSDISVQLSPTGPPFPACIDSGAVNSIIHYNTLSALLPNPPLLPLAQACSYDSPGNGHQTVTHCVALSLYVRAWRHGVQGLIKIEADVLVSTMQFENLLIGQDILRQYDVRPVAAHQYITFGGAGDWQAEYATSPKVDMTWGGVA